MFVWNIINRKIVYQFARNLKPRIPIGQIEMERKFEQQKSFLLEQAEKQIRHAHTISDLITLNQDISKYVDVSTLILKRLLRLKMTQEEFQQNQEFFIQTLNSKTYDMGLNLMQFYQNEQIERLLLDAFKNDKLQTSDDNNLRLLEIIAKYGNQEQLEKWVQKSEFKINAANISKFYKILDFLGGKLPDREILVNNLEKSIQKYTHILDYDTLYYILKYRSFNDKALNQDLLYAILKRLHGLDLTLSQLIKVNQYIMVELQYSDAGWLNLIGKSVLKALNRDQLQLEQKAPEQNEQEEEEIISEKQTINNPELAEKNDEEFLKFVQEFELREEPFVVTDLEKQLLILMEQLSKVIIINDLNLVALSFFNELDVHMMQFFNHLTPDEQLICIQFHAKYIETCYNEQQQDVQRYRKSAKKRLEQMNNGYYEITLHCLKELTFEQTLRLLTAASVLGVSKRKVCQHLLQVGIEGLNKIQECQLDNDKKNYALFVYFKLLKLFVTKETEILQIEDQFKQIKINTLDLQTEYAHLGLQRSQIQQLEQSEEKNNQA